MKSHSREDQCQRNIRGRWGEAKNYRPPDQPPPVRYEQDNLHTQVVWFFSKMAIMLRLNLFTYRALWTWLEKPYETLPILAEVERTKFNLQEIGQPL